MSLLEEMFDGSNEQLNERPYSRTQSAIDSAKGAVKGFFGSGQVEQGAQDSGQKANQLWADFKRYIGKKYGSHPQSVPFADVTAFFKGNGLDTSFLGNNQRRSFSPKDVGTALMQAVQKQNTEYDNDEFSSENKPEPQSTGNSQGASEPQEQPTTEPGSNIPDRIQSLSSSDRAKLLKLISNTGA